LLNYIDAAQHVSGIIIPIIRSSFKLQSQPPVDVFPAVVGLLIKPPTAGNTDIGGCDGSLKELLMIGIIMPATW
jgi:hypothetical protein